MLVNVTPHVITILLPSGGEVVLPPSGAVARVATTTTENNPLLHEGVEIPVATTTLGEVTNLPEPQEGTAFLASMIVCQAARSAGRTDVFSPGPLVRGPDGQPIGCKGLSAPA